MINMLKNTVIAIRIDNVLIAFICCWISFEKLQYYNIDTLFGILIVMLLIMGSNIFNDIFDIKTDAINCPERPLILYPDMKNYFLISGSLFLISAIILSFYLNYKANMIVLGIIPLLILYTPVFKKIIFLGNIIIAFFLGFVFIFIEITTLGTYNTLLSASIIAFFISLIREIIKDVEDYKGDKIAKIKTMAIYFGIKKTIYFSIILVGVFLAGFSGFLYYNSNLYFNIAVIFLVFFPLFYLIFFLIRSPTENSCSKASNLLKKVTILGLLIIYIM